MTIQPIVVIYNNQCDRSNSVCSLLQQSCKPIIIDNSTSDYGNRDFCNKNGLTYYSMGGNQGLTKAYNFAINQLDSNIDYIQWFDDDTSIPNGFIKSEKDYVAANPQYEVFIPIVISGKSRAILSPSKLINGNTYRINSLDDIENSSFSAINSGMIIKMSVFKEYRYDESLFLDCVDHDFMCSCWKNNVSICIMNNCILEQDFSGDCTNIKSSLNRYKIYSKDFITFRKKNSCNTIITAFLLFKRLISILLN